MRTRFALYDRLARDGGVPIRTQPFATWPVFDEETLTAVQNVLKSGQVNYWTGQECREFEREFADFIGTEHAIAVSNGTVALELALVAAGVKAGDDVIVSPRTFVATGSAVAMLGATPVFADIDPASGNVTAETIAAALTSRTTAIIVVHAFGWPANMPAIMKLAEQYGVKVIEDCAQAHGATIGGKKVGSFGHINSFSFCQDKIMTTGGEGGMVTTSCPQLWEAAWSFKDHGKSWDACYHREHKTIFKYLHESIGTNWRMTEMQGAIGRVAVTRLPEWIAQRRANFETLCDYLDEVDGFQVVRPESGFENACYKFSVNLSDEILSLGWSRDDIVRAIQGEGIPCGSGLCSEIYLEKALAGFAPDTRLPVASDFGERSVMFLIHPTLGEDDMEDIAAAATKVMRHVRKCHVPITRAA
jgi:dTDP-4-amino-4,6-dideoxygalactose transaminase